MTKRTNKPKGPAPRPPAERFWSHVNKDGPLPSPEAVAVHPEIAGQRCWIYGSDVLKRVGVWVDGRLVLAHRVAWFLATGRWPKPCCLHKCDRGGCVRFSHLFEGTTKDNTQDMIAKKRDRMIGTRQAGAKLTDEDIREIRRLGASWIRHPHQHGTAALVRRIAKRFGVSVATIKAILRNERYRA
jgi:hypothetical protein